MGNICYNTFMRVISKRTLQDFWNIHSDVINPLAGWYAEAMKASWQSPQDIKTQYKTASFLRDNRVGVPHEGQYEEIFNSQSSFMRDGISEIRVLFWQ